MGGGLEWIPLIFIAIPAYWLGLRIAQRVLQAHAVSDEALKRLCLGLLIVNAIVNLILLLILR
jgi:hypothetical protein